MGNSNSTNLYKIHYKKFLGLHKTQNCKKYDTKIKCMFTHIRDVKDYGIYITFTIKKNKYKNTLFWYFIKNFNGYEDWNISTLFDANVIHMKGVCDKTYFDGYKHIYLYKIYSKR